MHELIATYSAVERGDVGRQRRPEGRGICGDHQDPQGFPCQGPHQPPASPLAHPQRQRVGHDPQGQYTREFLGHQQGLQHLGA